MSFFYDAVKIREHFFIYLGKKRFSEEFLLLKNKKWYFKFYIQQYFNVPIKFIIKYYLSLRKKYKLHTIKELFLFLEYNINVFTKKYIYYYFKFFYLLPSESIRLNNEKINTSTKNIFFIGDLINFTDIVIQKNYYFEKFFIFFNIIYYINPLTYKNKFFFLKNIYSKLYDYIVQQLVTNAFFFEKKNSAAFIMTIKKKYVPFFIKSLYQKNIKLFIKSLYFFVFKYNIILFKQKQLSMALDKTYFIHEMNFKSLLYYNSFFTYYKKFKLIEFKYIFKERKKNIRASI